MNRQDRDRHDYGRYDGYNNDEHYHSARNLTDEFEREYEQRHGGQSNNDRNRMPQSYHEGSEVDDRYQRRNTHEDNFKDRSDYRQSDRSYDGNFGRANNNQGNDRRGNQDRSQERGSSPLRSENSGPYNPYNSDNYSRTREQHDNNTGLGDGYRGTRYGGNSDYLANQQHDSSRNRESSYRGGTSYSGPYGADEDSSYNRDCDRNNDDSWFGANQRNRYY